MSYDCSLEVDTGNGETISIDLGNYTYNCSMMLVKAIEKSSGKKETSLSDLDGVIAKEVSKILGLACIEMAENRKEYIEMNPENGWGDYDSWLEYLRNIELQCLKHPNTKLSVH